MFNFILSMAYGSGGHDSILVIIGVLKYFG